MRKDIRGDLTKLAIVFRARKTMSLAVNKSPSVSERLR